MKSAASPQIRFAEDVLPSRAKIEMPAKKKGARLAKGKPKGKTIRKGKTHLEDNEPEE